MHGPDGDDGQDPKEKINYKATFRLLYGLIKTRKRPFLVAFVYMVWVMAKTFVYGDPVRGYPTLMVTVLFFSGVQLIFLGVLGEYLGRVYEEVKARPLFLVREAFGIAPLDAPHHAPPASLPASTL